MRTTAMTIPLRVGFLLILAILLVGCSKLTKENVQKIHTGMTKAEVEAILGPPTETEEKGIPIQEKPEIRINDEKIDIPTSGGKSTWQEDGKSVTVVYLGDKVVSVESNGFRE